MNGGTANTNQVESSGFKPVRRGPTPITGYAVHGDSETARMSNCWLPLSTSARVVSKVTIVIGTPTDTWNQQPQAKKVLGPRHEHTFIHGMYVTLRNIAFLITLVCNPDAGSSMGLPSNYLLYSCLGVKDPHPQDLSHLCCKSRQDAMRDFFLQCSGRSRDLSIAQVYKRPLCVGAASLAFKRESVPDAPLLLLELWSGGKRGGKFHLTCARNGGKVYIMNIHIGWDLTNPDHQQEALQLICHILATFCSLLTPM